VRGGAEFGAVSAHGLEFAVDGAGDIEIDVGGKLGGAPFCGGRGGIGKEFADERRGVGAAGDAGGAKDDAVVRIDVVLGLGIDELRFKFSDDRFDGGVYFGSRQGVELHVGQSSEMNLGGTEQAGGLGSFGFLASDEFGLAWVLGGAAFGDDEDVYFGALIAPLGNAAANAEDFVVGMGGDDQDSHGETLGRGWSGRRGENERGIEAQLNADFEGWAGAVFQRPFLESELSLPGLNDGQAAGSGGYNAAGYATDAKGGIGAGTPDDQLFRAMKSEGAGVGPRAGADE
jgi:hypothetical protein